MAAKIAAEVAGFALPFIHLQRYTEMRNKTADSEQQLSAWQP
jgi:hypothetical protein